MTTPGWQRTVPSRAQVDALKLAHQRVAAQGPAIAAPPPPKVPVPRTKKAMESLEEDVSRRCKAAGITNRHAYDAVHPVKKAAFGGLADPTEAIPVLEEVGRIADEVAAASAEYAKRTGGTPKRARDRLRLLKDSGVAFDEWKDLAHVYIFEA